MEIQLFSDTLPDGRCLMLAHGLARLIDLDEMQALEEAQRLFDSQYDRQNPLVVRIRADVTVADVEKLCAEHGVKTRLP